MKILFINNDGGGFADYLEVQDGLTVELLFRQQLPDRQPGDFLIRVNREPVPRDRVLRDGDRITMTPTKIEGARAARISKARGPVGPGLPAQVTAREYR